MPGTRLALVDSSVLLAAMRTRDEPAHASSAELLRAAGSGGLELRMLDLTLYEVGNVMARSWGVARAQRERALHGLLGLCGEPIVPGVADHLAAGDIAADQEITVYDAMYAAIARRLAMPLISADERDLLSRDLAISPRAAVETWI